jgi:hypothetical protein
MLSTKFQFILESGFRGEDFLEIKISKNLLWKCLAKWTETWWEAPMEGSVLSFLKAEWKVSDTGSVVFLLKKQPNVWF